MNHTAKYRASFLLMVFVAYLLSGLALKGLSYDGTGTGQRWKNQCGKRVSAKHHSPVNKKNAFSGKKDSKKQGAVKIIPCNPSLQILPVASHLFTIPDHSSHSIVTDDYQLTSQLFVFREPDPPQLHA